MGARLPGTLVQSHFRMACGSSRSTTSSPSACLMRTSLRGEDWESPQRQFDAVHAYVREAWAEEAARRPDAVGRWDHERRLWPAVQLSRLVRDNNASTEMPFNVRSVRTVRRA